MTRPASAAAEPGTLTATDTYGGAYREYAAAIYELAEEGIPVRQVRIADWLGVSRPSVSEMVRRMADDGRLEVAGTPVTVERFVAERLFVEAPP